jgi:hypothetical protein
MLPVTFAVDDDAGSCLCTPKGGEPGSQETDILAMLMLGDIEMSEILQA